VHHHDAEAGVLLPISKKNSCFCRAFSWLTKVGQKKSLQPGGTEPKMKGFASPQGSAEINVDAAVKKTGGASAAR
jgi:hypothetical protein